MHHYSIQNGLLNGLGYDYLILLNRFVNWCLFKIGKEPLRFLRK
jgi:hypothetical protein